MYVELTKNNGTDYLRLVKNQRITNAQGKRSSTKKVVLNIGPLSRYDDGKDDYVKRLKQSFKDGKPIIASLIPYVETKEDVPKTTTVTFTEGEESCFGDPKIFSSCILDKVFSALGLNELLTTIKHGRKIKFDLQGITRLLTYGRLLEPASKIATMQQNDQYFIPPVKSSNDDNVYDTLDVIFENRNKIIQRMHNRITAGIGRNTENVFYDVTNFFFETEHPDKDETDKNGDVIQKGLRKMGVSKENRKQPIVQMGLFLDDKGIPISIETFPGNTLDHLTIREAMCQTVNTLKMDRFILVADRGVYSGKSMCHVVDHGDGYIVSKSLKKTKNEEQEWALNKKDFVIMSDDFRYKSRIVKRKVIAEDGSKREIKEKVVIYWSKSFYERERCENKSFLDFVEKLKENPNNFRITAAQSRFIKKFLRKEMINKETGEILDSRKLLAMIDDEKLTKFNELMGYYQIVSSELDMDDLEIIEKYHGLTKIEDQFREMKGTLETRPVYLSTPEHIKAHLIICFMALTMMRIIQFIITENTMPFLKKKVIDWSYGMSGKRISKALKNWQVDMLPGDIYRMLNVTDSDLKQILKAFNLTIPTKIFTRGELREIKSLINIF